MPSYSCNLINQTRHLSKKSMAVLISAIWVRLVAFFTYLFLFVFAGFYQAQQKPLRSNVPFQPRVNPGVNFNAKGVNPTFQSFGSQLGPGSSSDGFNSRNSAAGSRLNSATGSAVVSAAALYPGSSTGHTFNRNSQTPFQFGGTSHTNINTHIQPYQQQISQEPTYGR
jgi:hypothetical protein